MTNASDFLSGVGNGTSDTEIPQYVGFICCVVTSLLFGTNLIPVKKFETGDGMFFQWMFCNAVLICGLVIQCVRLSRFYPFVMVGGLLWATGNLCVVPIVKTIGLGLGLCIWASVMLLVGWANGRFGLIGIEAEIPANIAMNYGGVVLSLCSTVLYAFVRPEIGPLSDEHSVQTPREETASPASKQNDNISKLTEHKTATAAVVGSNYVETLSPIKKKFIGVTLAALSGALYAIQFIPAIYLQESQKGASQNSIDYVFAHFCGIHLASTVYFIMYVIYRRNVPHVYPRVILPALVSGAMWGVATALWFVANKALSEPVSFPIISTLPQGISLLVNILVFKEIKGRRNIFIVLVAMAFTISGAIVAGLSKSWCVHGEFGHSSNYIVDDLHNTCE